MATEAAVLGTTSVFINTLSGGRWQELENKYSLLFRFENYLDVKLKIEELLSDPGLKEKWQYLRDKMLKNNIYLANWIINYINTHASSQEFGE